MVINRGCRRLISRSISPIVSAVLLFIIALAAMSIALTVIASRSSYVSSLLDAMKISAERALREDLQIVYMAANRNGRVVIGLMNAGTVPIDLLALYVNGSPVPSSSIVAECGNEVKSLPLTMLSGDLCLLTISVEKGGKCYIVTIATAESSYSVKVYA